MESVLQKKAELRRDAIARRDALPAEARQAAAEAIAARAFPLAITPGTIVSGFMPLQSEINPLPLMRKLAGEGARLALPVVIGRGKPLIMREWTFGEPLSSGVWGIREPEPEAAEVEPDILLVPLLAFDRAGYRIGYGGGYYDRSLAALPHAFRLGCAFAAQFFEHVPTEPTDLHMHAMATELGVTRF